MLALPVSKERLAQKARPDLRVRPAPWDPRAASDRQDLPARLVPLDPRDPWELRDRKVLPELRESPVQRVQREFKVRQVFQVQPDSKVPQALPDRRAR